MQDCMTNVIMNVMMSLALKGSFSKNVLY